MHIYKSINIVGFASAVSQISHKPQNIEVDSGAVVRSQMFFKCLNFKFIPYNMTLCYKWIHQVHQGHFPLMIVIQKTKTVMDEFQLRGISFRKPSLMPYTELITPLSRLPLLLIPASIVEFIILNSALFLYLPTKL